MEDKGPGGEGCRHPSLQDADPQQRDSMGQGQHEGNASIYVLDELFYVYVQVKNSRRPDEKLMLAYEILCISANHCTN